MIRLVIIICSACLYASADVAQFVDLSAEWQPRPNAEKIETYWIFQRIVPSPIKTVALVTTNRSSAVISNVNTLLSYEWTIAASNSLGIGASSDIQLTPINPGLVNNGRIISVRSKIIPPCVIEEGPSLNNWSRRMVILGSSNSWSFTYTLMPGEPYRFWKFRSITNSAEIAPLPK